MRRHTQFWYQSKNAKERKESLLQRSRKGVAAREAKRLANPVEREPELIRYYPIQLGVRDKISGDIAWIDLRSVRDAARRLSKVLKYYQPGKGTVRPVPNGKQTAVESELPPKGKIRHDLSGSNQESGER
jgi:hypothetical protein